MHPLGHLTQTPRAICFLYSKPLGLHKLRETTTGDSGTKQIATLFKYAVAWNIASKTTEKRSWTVSMEVMSSFYSTFY